MKCASLLRPWFALLVIGFVAGACSRQVGAERLSPYYETVSTASDLGGHTSVQTKLWGHFGPEGKNETILLCYFLMSHALADPQEGRKIFFIGCQHNLGEKTRLFACNDGRNVRDVTNEVMQLGKKGGQIPLSAEYIKDFTFDKLVYEPTGLTVTFYVTRPEAGFGTVRAVPISWQSVNDKRP